VDNFGILSFKITIMNRAKKQINCLSLVLILTGLCGLAVQSARCSEPSYDGKPLSEWLLLLDLKQMGHSPEEIQAQTPQPEDAIRQIGTNAIPTLLKILGATEGNESRVLRNLKSREFRKLFSVGGPTVEDLTDLAVDGFGILGTNAASAIPQIVKLFHNVETCEAAAQALAKLGPQGIAALTNGLSNKNTNIRGATILAIAQKTPIESDTIARLIVGSLKDPDPVNRGNAAMFLSGKDPDLIIPALIPLLDDKEFYTVVHAARALGGYGAAAKSVVPKLLSLYTNAIVQKDRHAAQSWGVELMWALKGIDMDAAAKAEAFLVNSGPLNYARFGYSTTVLPNGKELIAGGYVHTEFPTPANRYLSSAELYDPATGEWTETGEMNTTRHDHTAILLRNEQVLVVGGSDSKAHDSTSAELYDPIIGKWTKTGSLNHTHRGMHAVLQPDGKVRIPGGWDGFKITNDELYDPATGAWAVIPKQLNYNNK
jgi:hypothetical protein